MVGLSFLVKTGYTSIKIFVEFNIMPSGIQLAAVDLGSNSFHLIIAELLNGRIHIVHNLREQVQLANGLTAMNELTPEAQQRALECLQRFGQYTQHLPPEQVAIVGTYTLRAALHLQSFLTQAEQALGHPIDIISGEQEARFIYDGVLYTCGISHAQRLIIDIGGGSTEIITGKETHTLLVNSVELGCVRLAQKFFKIEEGIVLWSTENFHHAYLAACNIFKPLRNEYRNLGWNECWGTSGTLNAVLQVLMAHGYSEQRCFNMQNLQKLRTILSENPSMDLATLPGLNPRRSNVFASGMSILCAFFDVFEIEEIHYATGGLREGLLYQLAQQHGLDTTQLIVNFV
jgi:exopolyphosphatase/guanosine-5'-triphosphate,3'-diphosphate pyrophosphatase